MRTWLAHMAARPLKRHPLITIYDVIMMMNDVVIILDAWPKDRRIKDTFSSTVGGHSISFAQKVQNEPKVQILPLCSCTDSVSRYCAFGKFALVDSCFLAE